MSALMYFAIIALLIVIISVVNEKWLHIQSDIVLVIFSLGISVLLSLLGKIPQFTSFITVLKSHNNFDFASYIL